MQNLQTSSWAKCFSMKNKVIHSFIHSFIHSKLTPEVSLSKIKDDDVLIDRTRYSVFSFVSGEIIAISCSFYVYFVSRAT